VGARQGCDEGGDGVGLACALSCTGRGEVHGRGHGLEIDEDSAKEEE